MKKSVRDWRIAKKDPVVIQSFAGITASIRPASDNYLINNTSM